MKKLFLFILPLLFLAPQSVFAATETEVSCEGYYCSKIRVFNSDVKDGLFEPGSSSSYGSIILGFGSTSKPVSLFYLGPKFLDIDDRDKVNYTLLTDHKYSFRMVLQYYGNNSEHDFPLLNETLRYNKNFRILAVDTSGNVLEDERLYKYLNFGVKKLKYDDEHIYFNVDLIPSHDLSNVSYLFFDISNGEDDDYSKNITDEYFGQFPVTLNPIFKNYSDYWKVSLSEYHVYEVDEFDFLEGTALDIPAYNGPSHGGGGRHFDIDKYKPDNSGIEDLKTCDSSNLIDRFSCYFDNFIIFFRNIFIRIGNYFYNLFQYIQELFIPENLDFLTDFKDVLVAKLGFIADIPLKVLDFLISLGSANWSSFDSITFPSVEMFGVTFWENMTIDLSEAKNIFYPFKYLTDIGCVVLCVNSLRRWYDNFANGGGNN